MCSLCKNIWVWGVCGLAVSPSHRVCMSWQHALYCMSAYSMFTYVHCYALFIFCTTASVSWHLCVFVYFMCTLQGTYSMTPTAIHYLWCLVYNIFALSRGPVSNWHINQQINTCTRRSLDGLRSAFPSSLGYLLYTHLFLSAHTYLHFLGDVLFDLIHFIEDVTYLTSDIL